MQTNTKKTNYKTNKQIGHRKEQTCKHAKTHKEPKTHLNLNQQAVLTPVRTVRMCALATVYNCGEQCSTEPF